MTRTIDRYEIVEPLGTGMFSTVFRAHDERLETDVAIKVLAENHSLNADIRSRFITEARTLRRLHTPHVVTLHDLGETTGGQPYMVLERCAGGSLADRVAAARREHRPATSVDVRRVADALAAGLGAMHAIRVVHRDISPSNLLLRTTVAPGAAELVDADDVVISDLGFVKDLERASGLTAAGGTHGFAAPEQQQPGAFIDHRADIYAATAVIEWLADGGLPTLDGFVATGKSSEPAGRFDDMRAWRTALERALTGPATIGGDAAADPPRHRATAPDSSSLRPCWRWRRSSAASRCGAAAGHPARNGRRHREATCR